MVFLRPLLALTLSSFLLTWFLCLAEETNYSSSKIGQGYRLITIEDTPDGALVGLLQVKQKNNIYGADIPLLRFYVKHETETRLRVHITDAKNKRWEVPYNLLPRQQPPPLKPNIKRFRKNSLSVSEYSSSELVFSYTSDPFSFKVKRKSNGENTQPNGFKLHPNDPYTLYTTDISAVNLNSDLYGSHPVYMDLRNEGGKPYAHGVLLLNSNGMDVFYKGNYLTYKIIGGVFDFYFFAGPSPLNVVDQYTAFVGRPAPMPYWAFGFHQCKWGYHNLSVIEDVVENYKKAKIPLDVIWNDDDHMDGHKDFTVNPINYPLPKLLSFLERIHNIGMKYIVINDPGIAVNTNYGVYQRGIANDVFIKYEGEPFMAMVWPGAVYFPDFLNPKTVSWWGDEIRRFHELVPIDGLWIDMNEVSNFCTGKCTIPKERFCPLQGEKLPNSTCCLDCTNITSTRWDDPPYRINASGKEVPIGYKTIATSAVHYNGVLEYDAHSLFGFSEAIATHKALHELQGKRPFVLSRSTYVGSGKYAAHWTGDNKGTWEDLRYSISTILNFGIFGMPMVGTDICGFYPAPTEELCNRWIETRTLPMGISSRISQKCFGDEAHISGAPIARPIFFSFPNYIQSYGLSTQFLLGTSLMISPVLEKGKTEVEALFPPGTWYSLFDLTQTIVSKDGSYVTLDAPLHEINVHLYQNTILPMQQGGMVSKDARMTPFSLIVTFPAGTNEGEAKGNLFLDDDEMPDMKLGNGYSTYIDFHATVKEGTVTVWSEVQEGKFALDKVLVIDTINVLGLRYGSVELVRIEIDGEPSIGVSNVKVGTSEHKYLYKQRDGEKKTVMVGMKGLNIPVGKRFALTWKMGS
ncbi:NAD(P)H-dependent D-xylose reductase (XR) [Trifolium repens]|nr:NAD(P)H-dependent D-xylose reductase (XR) [Trifolium repens]